MQLQAGVCVRERKTLDLKTSFLYQSLSMNVHVLVSAATRTCCVRVMPAVGCRSESNPSNSIKVTQMLDSHQ